MFKKEKKKEQEPKKKKAPNGADPGAGLVSGFSTPVAPSPALCPRDSSLQASPVALKRVSAVKGWPLVLQGDAHGDPILGTPLPQGCWEGYAGVQLL